MSNSFIRGYKVRVRPRENNSEEWRDSLVCNSSLNTTKEELRIFTEYEIQVAALNGAGRSNFSERIFCFTDADGEYRQMHFYLSVNVFSTKVLIGDTILTLQVPIVTNINFLPMMSVHCQETRL